MFLSSSFSCSRCICLSRFSSELGLIHKSIVQLIAPHPLLIVTEINAERVWAPRLFVGCQSAWGRTVVVAQRLDLTAIWLGVSGFKARDVIRFSSSYFLSFRHKYLGILLPLEQIYKIRSLALLSGAKQTCLVQTNRGRKDKLILNIEYIEYWIIFWIHVRKKTK